MTIQEQIAKAHELWCLQQEAKQIAARIAELEGELKGLPPLSTQEAP